MNDISPLVQQVELNITKALPNEKQRLDSAREAIETYRNEFARYDEYYDPDGHSTRPVPFMQFAVETLARNYKNPPARTHTKPTVQKFLESVYDKAKINAVMRAVDHYTHVGDTVAIELQGTTDPDNPVDLVVWTADSFTVYCHPEHPCKPVIVVTIDRCDEQTRYRMWTHEEVRTYLTDKLGPLQTFGGRVPRLVDAQPNPYGRLPFVFSSYRTPVVDWHCGGIGEILTEANQYLNDRLRQIGDSLRHMVPLLAYEGVSADFQMPRAIRPGEGIILPSGSVDARGDVVKPSIKWVPPELDWIVKAWDDLNNYWSLLLATIGAPNAIRLVANAAATSGVALLAEDLPPMLYAKSRQEQWTYFEQDLARAILEVAGAWLMSNGRPGQHLLDAAAEPIQVKWDNEDLERLLRPDRDAQDQALLDMGMVSKIQLIMRRWNLSEKEAIDHLKAIARHEELEKEILGEPEPPPALPVETVPPVEDAAPVEDAEEPVDEETDV
jgi:hypothetical protein